MNHLVADACNPAIAGCKPENALPLAFILVIVVLGVILIAAAVLIWALVRRQSARRTALGHQRAVPSHRPGWYPDPQRRYALRFWDGTTWTSSISDGTSTQTEGLIKDDETTLPPSDTTQ